MKNQRGVTLIALVITIIVMLILVGVVTVNSIGLYDITNAENFVAEMKVIQEKVNNIRESYKNWEPTSGERTMYNYCTLAEEDGGLGFSKAESCAYKAEFEAVLATLNGTEGITSWQGEDAIIANYCYFGPSDLESKLGIKGMDDVYVIINFNTGNVIEKDGVQDPDNKYQKIYRQYDYSTGNQLNHENTQLGNIEVKATIERNYGLSKIVKVEMISKKDGEVVHNVALPELYKVYYRPYVESENTNKWEDATKLKDYTLIGKTAMFTIETSGKYEFKVEDLNKNEYKMAIETYLDIALCNPPSLIDGMTPIYWENGEIKETGDINSPSWYDYSADVRKMANAKTEDGSIWVWIPRIAYTENTTTGTKDLGFVSGVSKTSTNQDKIYEKVFEAFSENGDVTGIWVGKFGAHLVSEKIVMSNTDSVFTTADLKDAKTNCTENVVDSVKEHSHLMTTHEKEAVLELSSLLLPAETTIAENTSNYPANIDYLSNIDFSSTGTEYGVYDLVITIGEITEDTEASSDATTDTTTTGIYRAALINK